MSHQERQRNSLHPEPDAGAVCRRTIGSREAEGLTEVVTVTVGSATCGALVEIPVEAHNQLSLQVLVTLVCR